jgi:NAD(P)-dependent dehydrogenase (short-subunit alcohol dehydrogenase family)
MSDERTVAFLTASNEALRRALTASFPQGRVKIETGDLGSTPGISPKVWICAVEFGEIQAVSCSAAEWGSAIRDPLRHAFLSVQAALRTLSSGGRILVIAVDPHRAAGEGGEVGLAALTCLVRSLRLEASPSSLAVRGIAVRSVGDLSRSLLSSLLQEEAGLPATWLDLRAGRTQGINDSLPAPFAQATKTASARPTAAVVTGAARGLGRAIAERLAAGGAAVLLFDQDGGALRSAENAFREQGFEAGGFEGDVASRDDVARAAKEAVGRWGRLDAWINNAGIVARGTISELKLSDWDRTFDVNLNGTLWGCQAAFAEMQKHGGAILNMSSTASRTAGLVYPGRYNAYAPYAASKAGVEAIPRILAGPPAAPSVRVNALAPGPILTELVERIYTQQQRAELEAHIPLGRLGRPEDVAAGAAFLLSTEADFIHGHVLVVDGGLSAAQAQGEASGF